MSIDRSSQADVSLNVVSAVMVSPNCLASSGVANRSDESETHVHLVLHHVLMMDECL